MTGRGPNTGSTSHFKHCPAFSHKHGIIGSMSQMPATDPSSRSPSLDTVSHDIT